VRGFKSRSKAERSAIIQTFAKEMRQAPTDAEARLWHFLRNRRLDGWKFRRQHALANYIVDFICVDGRLVIELDGGQHADIFAKEKDAQRSAFLAERGFRVLRFWNNEVLQQTASVLEQILATLDELKHPSPQPSPQGEREYDACLFVESSRPAKNEAIYSTGVTWVRRKNRLWLIICTNIPT